MGTKITYENDDLHFEIGGIDYRADVKATADYWYQPCVMYFKDGSGQPEDEGWEVEDFDVIWYKDNVEIEPTDEMIVALEDYLYELDLSEWEFPEEPEEPETPEPEDW